MEPSLFEHSDGVLLLVARLRKAADDYPIGVCDEAPHERHRAEFLSGIKLCFTRNVTPEGDKYYLSFFVPDGMNFDREVMRLVPLFFNPQFPVEEVRGIETPGVRCFAQDLWVPGILTEEKTVLYSS